jgi:hypothetical protein
MRRGRMTQREEFCADPFSQSDRHCCAVDNGDGRRLWNDLRQFRRRAARTRENALDRVTLIDLFVGFLVAGARIEWREASAARAVPWLMTMLVIGNPAVGIYLVKAAWTAGTTQELLIGDRARPPGFEAATLRIRRHQFKHC